MDPFTTKIIVLLALAFVIIQLGRAFYFMARPQASKKMLKALMGRVTTSLLIFVLLMLAFAMGWLTPHGLPEKGHPVKKNAPHIIWLDTNRLQV